MDIVRREQREAFITADGSSIRELAGIPSGNTSNQSLAEAIVPPGSATIAHFHHRSEEIYLFTHGSGRMRLGSEEHTVRAGDCVVIPPGVAHKLWSDDGEPLILLCCCAPAYSHRTRSYSKADFRDVTPSAVELARACDSAGDTFEVGRLRRVALSAAAG